MVFFATFAQFFATFAVSLVLSDVDQNLNRKVRKEIPQRTREFLGLGRYQVEAYPALGA